mgnify:CR=1 FL=1
MSVTPDSKSVDTDSLDLPAPNAAFQQRHFRPIVGNNLRRQLMGRGAIMSQYKIPPNSLDLFSEIPFLPKTIRIAGQGDCYPILGIGEFLSLLFVFFAHIFQFSARSTLNQLRMAASTRSAESIA